MKTAGEQAVERFQEAVMLLEDARDLLLEEGSELTYHCENALELVQVVMERVNQKT